MKKYCFSVDGVPVALFADIVGEADCAQILSAHSEGEIAASITFDREYDFRIECFDKNNTTPREPHLIKVALSHFFERVRTYPDMTLDAICQGKKYEIEICSHKEHKFSINSRKCKKICTKTVQFNDKTELEVDIVEGDILCYVAVVNDAELFDTGRLTLLFHKLLSSGISSAMVISYKDNPVIKTVGDVIFYEAIGIATDILASDGVKLPEGECEAVVNGNSHRFFRDGRRLTFYPKVNYIP